MEQWPVTIVHEATRKTRKSLMPISKGHPSCGVEEMHVSAIISGPKAHPGLLRSRPFLPKPSQAKSPCGSFKIWNTQATHTFGTTDLYSIDLALAATNHGFASP
jgi:hypothetical protein